MTASRERDGSDRWGTGLGTKTPRICPRHSPAVWLWAFPASPCHAHSGCQSFTAGAGFCCASVQTHIKDAWSQLGLISTDAVQIVIYIVQFISPGRCGRWSSIPGRLSLPTMDTVWMGKTKGRYGRREMGLTNKQSDKKMRSSMLLNFSEVQV